jgi:hypothetical protein
LSYLKSNSILTKSGVIALVIGFISSEIVLLALGFSILILANLFILLMASILMAMGVLLILIGQRFSEKTT